MSRADTEATLAQLWRLGLLSDNRCASALGVTVQRFRELSAAEQAGE